MNDCHPNPACRCRRCSTRGLMGPAVLVTVCLLNLGLLDKDEVHNG
jgi:hypothetical protein